MAVARLQPGDGWRFVAPLADLRAAWSAELVSGAGEVELTDAAGRTIEVVTRISGAILIVDPIDPLPWDTAVSFAIRGFETVDGPAEDLVGTFHTHPEMPWVSRTWRCSDRTLEPETFRILEEVTHQAGTDLVCGTPDDVLVGSAEYRYDESGRPSRVTSVDAEGGLDYVQRFDYADHRRTESFWGPDESFMLGWEYVVLDAAHEAKLRTIGAGADGLPFSDDDRWFSYYLVVEDPDVRGGVTWSWFENGTDGIPLTDDDELQSYSLSATPEDPVGASVSDFGPDGEPRTADDLSYLKNRVTFDERGRVVEDLQVAAGADRVWGTEDDYEGWRKEWFYDDDGLLVEHRDTLASSRIWWRHYYAYDADGFPTRADKVEIVNGVEVPNESHLWPQPHPAEGPAAP